MSEDVVLGGTHLSWLQTLSDVEILQWPVNPPHVPEDIASYAIGFAERWGGLRYRRAGTTLILKCVGSSALMLAAKKRQRRTSVMFLGKAF